MKKILLLLILIAQVALGQATEITLDGIKNYPKNDTIKVEMMIDYCVANVFSNKKDNLITAQQAYLLSKNLKYTLGEIRALNCIGNYYYQQAIYEKAINYYTLGLKISEKTNDIKNIVIGKSNLASVYTRTNAYEKAITLFKEIDSLMVKNGDTYSQNRAAILE